MVSLSRLSWPARPARTSRSGRTPWNAWKARKYGSYRTARRDGNAGRCRSRRREGHTGIHLLIFIKQEIFRDKMEFVERRDQLVLLVCADSSAQKASPETLEPPVTQEIWEGREMPARKENWGLKVTSAAWEITAIWAAREETQVHFPSNQFQGFPLGYCKCPSRSKRRS